MSGGFAHPAFVATRLLAGSAAVLLAIALSGCGSATAPSPAPVWAAPTHDGWSQLTTAVDTGVEIGANYAHAQLALRQGNANVVGLPDGSRSDLPPLPGVRKFAVAGRTTFALTGAGAFRLDGDHWKQISPPLTDILPGAGLATAGASNALLFGIDEQHHRIVRYDGTGWTDIGTRGSMVATVGLFENTTLYRLAEDRSSIWEYTGRQRDWRQIGGPAEAIFGGPAELWVVSEGALRTYRSGTWSAAPAPSSSGFTAGRDGRIVFGSSGTAYYLSPDRRDVWALRRPSFDAAGLPLGQLRWYRIRSDAPVAGIVGFGSTGAANPNLEVAVVLADGRLLAYRWAAVRILTETLPRGTVDREYRTYLSAAGGSGSRNWFVQGALPSGIRLQNASGNIEGTPTQAGPRSFRIVLVDSAGSVATQDLTITVEAR